MSTFLLTTILVGPKNMPGDSELVQRAVENAKCILTRAKMLDALELDSLVTEVLLDEVEAMGGPKKEEIDLDDWLDRVLRSEDGPLDPEKVVREFIETWNMAPSDTNWRDMPCDPERIIMLAGGMTTSDDPDSDSFKVFRRAEQLGVFKVLGIE